MLERVSSSGNGLFASRPINKGEVIFTELPICCATLTGLPHCAHCGRSLAPRSSVGLGHEDADLWPDLPQIPCASGCGEIYCSIHCRESASSMYHCIICPGQPASENCKTTARANIEKLLETFLSIFDLIRLSLTVKNEDQIQHDHVLINEEINLNERI